MRLPWVCLTHRAAGLRNIIGRDAVCSPTATTENQLERRPQLLTYPASKLTTLSRTRQQDLLLRVLPGIPESTNLRGH
jgi:hypothetical protein